MELININIENKKNARGGHLIKWFIAGLIVLLMLGLSTIEVYAEGSLDENIKDVEDIDQNQAQQTSEVIQKSRILGFENSDIGLDLTGFKETLKIKAVTPDHFRFEEAGIRVDFMMDDLTKTPHKAYNNSVYSAGFIQTSDYTSAYEYDKMYLNGHRTHIYTFERKALKYGKGLKRHFAYIEVELESQVLLSLHIASEQTFNPDKWIERLRAKNDDQSLIENYAISQIQNTASVFKHETTQAYFDDTFIESEDVTWGIFEPSTHYELDYVHAIEQGTGIDLDIILEYYDLGYMPRLEKMKMLSEDDKVLELTFQTSKYGTFNADALYEVLDGKHDATIDELISIIKAHDQPILFRPNNEMNGDWCSYNAMYTHKDAEVFRSFWIWLHDRFEASDVENVIWVWNPNWGDFPYAGWNDYMNYFPGEKYVDVIGLTGYNTGTYYEAEEWRSFLDIYLPMLWEYDQHFDGFPYMITEFGSSSTGGDKGQWIQNAFDQIEKLDIKAAVWWNHVDYDTQKGVVSRGYKFDDDPEVMEIFRDKFYGK
ncbi:glycoside hydrolase family 26 protein [Fusibacter sp. JL216-2]|uniref:glycoside hydrolase family 26 protein n=1 Tax=Fusibacter sp. JL216-2 TaxID=3071453 RepID=UPI003D33849E